MNDRDKELDDLLTPMRGVNPGDLNIEKWKRSIRKRQPVIRKYQIWGTVAAALIIGFVLGVGSSKVFSHQNSQEESFATSATKVEQFVNIDWKHY